MPEVSRYDIDVELSKAIPRGACTRLAEHRNVKLNNVTKYYNPHDLDYQSVFSKALLELQVIARVAPLWARNIVGVFNRFGVEWCGVPQSAQPGGVLQEIISTAAKLLDPNTPEVDRMTLALKLHADAGIVVDGLRFADREDAVDDEPMNRPVVNARAR